MGNSSEPLKIINEALPLLIPLIVLQLSLQLYSIVNLVKRKSVKYGNKTIWAIIILCFGIIGSVLYIALKGEDE